jgi:hypothetical protein
VNDDRRNIELVVPVVVEAGQEPNRGGGGGISVMEGVLSIVGCGGVLPKSDNPRRRRSMLNNLPSNNDAETSKLLIPLLLPALLLPPLILLLRGRESSIPLAYRATKLQIKQLLP